MDYSSGSAKCVPPTGTESAPSGLETAPPRQAVGRMFITVVMPVRNEARFIEQTLLQLVEQDYDPARFEVVVVDGESSDGTPQLVSRFAERHENVRIYSNPKRLGSAARNVALRHARGDVVVIIDGHCELTDRGYLGRLASAFERSGADCVGRPQPLDISGATLLQRAIAAARSSPLGHHPDSFVYSSAEQFAPAASVAVAYRREVFDRLGPFDERFDACEDYEFNHRVDRAGLSCFFTPDATVRYAPRATLAALFRQLLRYGRGRIRLWRKHPDSFSPGIVPPPLFVAGLLAGLPLSFAAGWLAAIYLAALLLYSVTVLAAAASIAIRRRSPALLLPLLAVFPTIHIGAGTG
ncbi:MAG: glycosyltransferase family 2 protein, partial [Pirellulaceae bacterium]|nr:glycosyltransferase family 2 protein [Pirellulaceae bacterium]